MLLLEPVVEPLCNTVDVERLARASGDLDYGRVFDDVECQRLELLDQRLASLSAIEGVLAVGRRASRQALDPLPDLAGTCLVDEDDQMLVDGLLQLAVDPYAERARRYFDASVDVSDHAGLFRNRVQVVRTTIDLDLSAPRRVVPAELFQEQPVEIKVADRLSDLFRVERHS